MQVRVVFLLGVKMGVVCVIQMCHRLAIHREAEHREVPWAVGVPPCDALTGCPCRVWIREHSPQSRWFGSSSHWVPVHAGSPGELFSRYPAVRR